MIPILYDKNETVFTSNGLARLRDCISCIVTEERNGIYECDFEYPVTGQHYELIKVGRIIGVTHDDLDDVQPFDIESSSKPIDGIVSFHCTHISYRQTHITYRNSRVRNLDSLTKAFTDFTGPLVYPANPFSYSSDKTSTGYLACNDGVPRSVRQMLGGIEGSILDTYGGEFEWNRWNVILHSNRGVQRPFAIRYGVNMLSYDDELDASDSFRYGLPFWTDGENTVVGSAVDAGGSTPADHDETVALDLSERFESQPTATALQNEAISYLNSLHPYLPTQTINVSFVRLQDMAGYEDFTNLERCELCDTIKVVFPDYGTDGYFKIVKTVWNALQDKYDEMELGSLSTTLSEALGITISPESASSGGGGNVFDDLTVNNDLSVGGDTTMSGTLASGNHTVTGNITASGSVTDGNGNTIPALTAPTSSISTTTGTLVEKQVHRFGKVVQLTIRVQNSSSVSSGSNVYVGTLNTTALRPIDEYALGVGYTGARAMIGSLSSAGAITIRNASASSLPANTGFWMSFTYIAA